jgi:probable HAF family extracellular repeat protein
MHFAYAKKTLVFCAFILASLTFTSGKANAISYSLTDLGIAGESSSAATAINNSGQVVGYNSTGAFLYDSGSMTYIPPLGTAPPTPYDINDSGQVIGDSKMPDDSTTQAFIYDNGITSEIPTTPSSTVAAINNSGQIVGRDYYTGHAFYYDPTTGLQTYKDPTNIYTAFTAINDQGVAVGNSYTIHDDSAFIYRDGAAEEITISGSIGDNHVSAINNHNQILGRTRFGYDGVWSYILSEDGSIERVDVTLGGNIAHATSLNNTGQVVGYSNTSSAPGGDYHAFLYEGGQMIDLNDFITDLDWVLSWALDINDFGQIVGVGLYNGQNRAFLLTPDAAPVPEPSTILLLFAGLLGLAGYRLRNK